MQGSTSFDRGNQPVKRWNHYITRQKECEKFFRALRDGDGSLKSIEVLGTHGSGITEFMKNIVNLRETDPDCCEEPLQDVVMVYVNVEAVVNLAEFFEVIAKSVEKKIDELLKRTLVERLKGLMWFNDDLHTAQYLAQCFIDHLIEQVGTHPTNLSEFEHWKKRIQDVFNRAYFAILLDGFDHLAQHPKHFKAEFLNKLRSLAQEEQNRWYWIIGTHRRLLDVCHDISGGQEISPFWNIFEPGIHFGVLDEEEVRRLVDAWAVSREVEISTEEYRFLGEIAGPWPRILNDAADWYTRLKKSASSGISEELLVKELLEKCPKVSEHFEAYWRDLTPEKTEYLRAIAINHLSPGSKYPYLFEELGVVKTVGNRKLISSSLFAEWIRSCSPIENKVQYPMRESDIYSLVGSFNQTGETQKILVALLSEIRQDRIEQALAQRAIATVMDAVEEIRSGGVTLKSPELQHALEVLADKGSSLDFNQQFELTLPIIPLLLEYKVSLGAGVELGAVWEELCDRISKAVKRSAPKDRNIF